jgi:hypothetical protein
LAVSLSLTSGLHFRRKLWEGHYCFHRPSRISFPWHEVERPVPQGNGGEDAAATEKVEVTSSGKVSSSLLPGSSESSHTSPSQIYRIPFFSSQCPHFNCRHLTSEISIVIQPTVFSCQQL